MRTPQPDLGPEIQSICEKLGFPDKRVVREITVSGDQATVLYFELDDDGKKHIRDDGNVATGWRKFPNIQT